MLLPIVPLGISCVDQPRMGEGKYTKTKIQSWRINQLTIAITHQDSPRAGEPRPGDESSREHSLCHRMLQALLYRALETSAWRDPTTKFAFYEDFKLTHIRRIDNMPLQAYIARTTSYN